jgi:hypothetical protein
MTMVDPQNDQIKSLPLNTQALDQGHGLIAEHEGRIKLYIISNPANSLDHQISSIQRSMTMVNSPTITQLQLRSLGNELNHTQVMVQQSTSTVGSS